MLARPGLSMGLAPLPPRKTRTDDTTGTPFRWFNTTCNPFASLNVSGVGNVSVDAGPAGGRWARHGSSEFTDSDFAVAAGGFSGVGTAGPRTGSPATP